MVLLKTVFLLFLLVLDWKEDAFCGNYVFCRPMASTAVCPIDTILRDGTGLSHADQQYDPALPATTAFIVDPLEFSLALPGVFVGSDFSSDSLYLLMSLQL